MCQAACTGAIELKKYCCHLPYMQNRLLLQRPALAQTHWKLWLVPGRQTAEAACRVSQLLLQGSTLYLWSWLCLHPTQCCLGWGTSRKYATLAGTVTTAKHSSEVPAGGLGCRCRHSHVP